MKKIILYIILGLVVISVLIWFFYFKAPVTENNNGPVQEVALKLKWLHQAQFAGNYVAAEKGFYNDQGLKVNISPYDFKTSAIDSVVNGDAQFGIAGADELLIAREKGAPIKAIAVIYKINPAVAYSLKKSGIVKPTDFIGKKVGLQKGSNVIYLYDAMLKKLNIDHNKIKEVEIGHDTRELLDGSVDVSTGYLVNEPNLAKEAGYEVNIIPMSDYGADMYADVIFTTENLINTSPGLVGKFLGATLDGWQYAIENEQEAVAITLRYAIDSTKIHEANMLNSSIPLISTGDSVLGWMEQNKWEQAVNILLSEKILTKPIKVEDAFTTKFLSDFYLRKKI